MAAKAARGVKRKKPRHYNKTSVLFDATELPVVTDAAVRKGLSVSTYVRSIIRKEHGLGDFGSVAAG